MEKQGVSVQKRRVAIILSILCGLGSMMPVSAFSAQAVPLAWDASPDPDVLGYAVYYGVQSGNYTNSVAVTNTTTASVPALIEGTTYYFAAKAFKDSGVESDFSNEVSYSIPPGTNQNQAPTLNALANLTLTEDAGAQSISLSGISSGAANETQTLTVSATSSNPALIPTPTVSYTSPNATGSLTFTPVANASGNAVITVTVNDGQTQNSTISRTFTVTVNAVNDVPTLNTLSDVTVNEDSTAQTVSLSGISSGAANESQTLTVTATSSNPTVVPNPTVNYTSPNATGSLTFTPVANANGNAVITVTVNDGQTQNNTISKTFTVTVNAVNDLPTLNALGDLSVAENSGAQTVNLSGITSGAANESQPLGVSAVSSNPGLIPNPTINYTSPNATGTLTFSPAANANGTALITVTVNDGQSQNNSLSRTFTVTVNSVNNPPTLDALGDIALNSNAAQQTVNLTGIGSGAANEAQTLTMTASSSNPALIPNPTISYTSPNATGTLRFTPVANMSGSASITVTVNDGQTQNNLITRTFTVTVNDVNTPPTLNGLNNLAINEDAAAQTVNLSGITAGAAGESQPLIVTATSSNPGLIPNPTVTYTSPSTTGSLVFAPVTNASGVATITVTVNDGQATSNVFSRSFSVTVNAVNDAPTLNPLGNLVVAENSGVQSVSLLGISSGAANEVQTLTLNATSSNPGLIPNPTINYSSPNNSGVLSFSPTPNLTGIATITVTVSDGQALNGTVVRSFTVTVNAVNDPPTLDVLSDLNLNEDAGIQTVNLSGITSGAPNEIQTLSVAAVSSNPGLIPNPTVTYTSPSTTGILTFSPVTNASGTAIITVSVNDGQAQNNITTRTFNVVVGAVNDPPTVDPINNILLTGPGTTGLNPPPQTIWLTGIGSGAGNEVQSLTVTASSSNPSVVQQPTVAYTSPNSTGMLTFTPVANAIGKSTITVVVNDGQSQTSRSFDVTVSPDNQPPTISAIPSQFTPTSIATAPIPFAISDPETAPSNLVVTVTSTNQTLVPKANIVLAGTNGSRTVKITPSPGRTGECDIQLMVSDGVFTTTNVFHLDVHTPAATKVTVMTNGNGVVYPNMSLFSLPIGLRYALTAVPAVGQEFAGWVGSLTASTPTLSFTMASNLVFTAKFVPSPYIPIAGTYNGLFYEDDEVRLRSSGFVTVSVTSRGSYSGWLQSGSARYFVYGKMGLDCRATNVIVRPRTNSLTLELSFGSGDQADQLTGRLTDGNWTAEVVGDRSVFAYNRPAPYAGNYTVVFPGQDGDPSLPRGDGYGAVSVTKAGAVNFSGQLADGTRLYQYTTISKDGHWPLYSSLYVGKGALLGWIQVTNQPTDDLNGTLSWIKQSGVYGAFYPNGFTNECKAIGSAYKPPVNMLTNHILALTNAWVAFSGGNLVADFSNSIKIGNYSQVSNLSSNYLSLNFSTYSGLFTGLTKDPSTGKYLFFQGAVLQKQNAGFGFLLGTNQSSRVLIKE